MVRETTKAKYLSLLTALSKKQRVQKLSSLLTKFKVSKSAANALRELNFLSQSSKNKSVHTWIGGEPTEVRTLELIDFINKAVMESSAAYKAKKRKVAPVKATLKVNKNVTSAYIASLRAKKRLAEDRVLKYANAILLAEELEVN